MMNQRRTHFEDLPNELFGVIFEYLAPHDLLYAFKKLNRRFKSILMKQPLSLPNNRQMNFNLYYDYLTKILPKYASQIVHLHLSERRAPHAVEWFVSQVPLNIFNWPTLKAVTMKDVPRHILETLLDDSSFLSKIESLSLDIGHHRYHCDEYNECNDFGIVIPILSSLPELSSLYMRIVNWPVIYDGLTFNGRCPRMDIHRNLQRLSIIQCSRELLVELLDNGNLPHLRRLYVALSCKTHDDMAIDPPNPIPLKQIFVPELRHVSINLFVGVTWVLTFFEDLQQHSQLDHFNLSGHVRFTNNSNFPRVATLQRWLTLTKSNVFKFQMKLSADYVLGAERVREDVFAEYRRATGDEFSARYREINICYPQMSFLYPMEMNKSNSTTSDVCIPDEEVDENMEEMKIFELDYVEDELLEKLQSVLCWHRLKKIRLEGDVPDDNYVVGENISHFFHIAQRSPQLRELYIESDLKYGRVLSSNIQLGILLASQLEILYFTAKEANSSLGDLVQIVDTLFGYSTSSPCLKQLTVNVDGHPSSWLSTNHLVQWINKIFKRFPALIHFSLYCQPKEAYQDSDYNLSKLAPEWFALSLLARKRPTGSLNYRHKPHSLDIWL